MKNAWVTHKRQTHRERENPQVHRFFVLLREFRRASINRSKCSKTTKKEFLRTLTKKKCDSEIPGSFSTADRGIVCEKFCVFPAEKSFPRLRLLAINSKFVRNKPFARRFAFASLINEKTIFVFPLKFRFVFSSISDSTISLSLFRGTIYLISLQMNQEKE